MKRLPKRLLSAIKLVDGTVIYSRKITRGEESWYVEDFKYCAPGEPARYINDEHTGIHDDAIEVVFHLLRGGKERKKENYEHHQTKTGDEPPTPA